MEGLNLHANLPAKISSTTILRIYGIFHQYQYHYHKFIHSPANFDFIFTVGMSSIIVDDLRSTDMKGIELQQAYISTPSGLCSITVIQTFIPTRAFAKYVCPSTRCMNHCNDEPMELAASTGRRQFQIMSSISHCFVGAAKR